MDVEDFSLFFHSSAIDVAAGVWVKLGSQSSFSQPNPRQDVYHRVAIIPWNYYKLPCATVDDNWDYAASSLNLSVKSRLEKPAQNSINLHTLGDVLGASDTGTKSVMSALSSIP